MDDPKFEPEGSVSESFIEPRADPILTLIANYGVACMVDGRAREADATWKALAADVLNLRRESRSAQAAAREATEWLSANRQRLHAVGCVVHQPSAQCSCGLHRILSYTRAIANGNAALFIAPDGKGDCNG